MMKLWVLRPKGYETDAQDPLWSPWYDKTFGFVVRAETEQEAREYAQANGGAETGWNNNYPAWISEEHSTCVELTPDGEPGVVIEDVAMA